MTRNVAWAHLPSACPITTQSKSSEEGEGDNGTDTLEASSVEVDSNCKQVLPRVILGRAATVLNTEGWSTTGRVFLDTKSGELFSAMFYGVGLADSSLFTAD